jgi:alkaline phosphatase D
VQTPGSAVHTKATFVVEDRVPGVQQTYLRPLDPSLRSLPDITAEETVRLETERP